MANHCLYQSKSFLVQKVSERVSVSLQRPLMHCGKEKRSRKWLNRPQYITNNLNDRKRSILNKWMFLGLMIDANNRIMNKWSELSLVNKWLYQRHLKHFKHKLYNHHNQWLFEEKIKSYAICYQIMKKND